MIVESHSHINLALPGIEDSAPWYGRAIEGPAQYLDSYDQNGVDAGWVFPGKGFLDSELITAENTALSQLHQEYPNRLYPYKCKTKMTSATITMSMTTLIGFIWNLLSDSLKYLVMPAPDIGILTLLSFAIFTLL